MQRPSVPYQIAIEERGTTIAEISIVSPCPRTQKRAFEKH
jgi:hypothetical protein